MTAQVDIYIKEETVWAKLCNAPYCTRESKSKGLCNRHYLQLRRHGRLTPELEYGRRLPECQAPDCDQHDHAKGYCPKHYRQLRKFGKLVPEREYGKIRFCKEEDCLQVHCARGYCRSHYYKYITKVKRKEIREKNF
jgi:hypothetical protein